MQCVRHVLAKNDLQNCNFVECGCWSGHSTYIISKILKDGFQTVVIPQTLKLTNLIYLKEEDVVNVEFDILGKYIKSL